MYSVDFIFLSFVIIGVIVELETIRVSLIMLMRPKWPKLANLAQKIWTFWFQFIGAFFASKGHPFKNM